MEREVLQNVAELLLRKGWRTSCFVMTIPGTAMRAISAKYRSETARFPDMLIILWRFREFGRLGTGLISGSLGCVKRTA
ncbi:MAG: hypothetical protein RSC76_06755, partial [Oscillospiraceae bacterium]